jgi:hypothetical protein
MLKKTLVGSLEEKKPLGRPKCRCEDNIKIVLKKTQMDIADWIHLAKNMDHSQAFLNTGMNLLVL